MVDYRHLYADKCKQADAANSRIKDVEASRQRLYERTLLNVRNLQSQLSSVHDEAKQRNDRIQSFLASFLPQFQYHTTRDSSPDDDDDAYARRLERLRRRRKQQQLEQQQEQQQEKEQEQQQKQRRKPSRGDTVPYQPDSKHDSACGTSIASSSPATSVQPTPSTSPEVPTVPQPRVEYQWSEQNVSSSSYHFMTRSSPIGRGGSKVDELKLCLKFDVNSKELPTKIQLEMTDPKTGRVVFKKRQNIYYVKLQERVAVIDPMQNYNLEIKSVLGEDESVDNITIYSKELIGDKLTQGISCQKEEAVSLPALEYATEVFVDSPAFSQPPRPIPSISCQRLTASASVQSNQERLHMARKASVGIALLASPPSPPPASSVRSRLSSPSGSSHPTSPTSMMVLSKPLSVPSVRYRWQRGFRKAPNGRYVKVPLLRLAFRFDDHRHQLLPSWLDLTVEASSSPSAGNKSKGDDAGGQKRCNLSGREGMCELQLDDGRSHRVVVSGGGGGKIGVAAAALSALSAAAGTSTGNGGADGGCGGDALDHLMPDFTLKVDSVGPGNFNQWQTTSTSIQPQH